MLTLTQVIERLEKQRYPLTEDERRDIELVLAMHIIRLEHKLGITDQGASVIAELVEA